MNCNLNVDNDGAKQQQQNHVACLIIYCNLWQQIEINKKKIETKQRKSQRESKEKNVEKKSPVN